MHFGRTWIASVGVLAAVMAAVGAPAASAGKGPLKVFILAGQSNMEGHARTGTLDYLGEDPDNGKLLSKVKQPGGSLATRDDVWIWYLGRTGKLTGGFGVSPGKKIIGAGTLDGKEVPELDLGLSFGPELGFGIVMGDYYEEPVLLIKTAWGGHSLYGNFRPPSSGGTVGPSYTNMVDHVKEVTGDLKKLFPDYDESQGYEIAGFLWFQGFNDQFKEETRNEYEQNMAHLITDLRKEFKVPNMPAVIGALGTGGQKGPIAIAQEKAANRPEFKGTVAFVETAQHWDKTADEMVRKGVWRTADRAQFYRIASERPYHYLGSGKMMFLMGHDFGEAMVKLVSPK
jgi:hypothetical protein